MGYSVGIDVGTSYTAAAIGREGRADVFELGSHSAAVPTVLAFESGGGVVVGEAAQWLSITDPECVVREFKRRLGDPVPILVGGQPHHADDLMAQTIRWVVDQVVGREDQAPDSVTRPVRQSRLHAIGMERPPGRRGLAPPRRSPLRRVRAIPTGCAGAGRGRGPPPPASRG